MTDQLYIYMYIPLSTLYTSIRRKVLKKISVAELQPDETVGAVREARLLAKVKIECRLHYCPVH